MNNTTGSVWQPVTLTATGLTTVTGNVFVARTPEVFSYDLDGNMTSDGRWNYTWDAENRLIKVESRPDTPSSSWRRIEWTYDALGRRIQQVTSIWTNNAWFVEENLKFVSDPMLFGRHIVELNATNNTLVRSYAWGLDLSGTMDGAGGVGGLLWVTLHAASGPAAGTHFAAYDGNGNVVALVSATTGIETARYEYGPVGEPIRISGPAAILNPCRFSTKRTDPTTDLVLYEYRAYNPIIGRWLSRDPIGEKGGKNLFAFVDNDGINFWDDLGHQRHPPRPRPPRPPGPNPEPVPAGECRIQVCCSFVMHSVYEHCYVRFDDDNGVSGCRAGPSRRRHGSGSSGSRGGVPSHCRECCGFWGTIIAGCGGRESPEMAGDFEKENQACVTLGQGAEMCRVVECIRAQMQGINQECVRYRVSGPNSNSALYTALQQCLGTATRPSNIQVPGWEPITPDHERCK